MEIDEIAFLTSVIKGRRSVRLYREEEVPCEILVKILEAGQWAPSPSNVQSWRFIVVKDGKVLRVLKNLAPGFPETAPIAIVLCSDQHDMHSFEEEWRIILAAEEAAVAMQNMMLTAYSLGLGSCPVVSFSSVGMKELLKLPTHVISIILMALGFPLKRFDPPLRKELSQIVYWDQYREEYDEER